MMYGMPFPGDYLLAPDGTVRDKLFLPSYEHRASATALALRNAKDAALLLVNRQGNTMYLAV